MVPTSECAGNSRTSVMPWGLVLNFQKNNVRRHSHAQKIYRYKDDEIPRHPEKNVFPSTVSTGNKVKTFADRRSQ
jgi:hypothetical protein